MIEPFDATGSLPEPGNTTLLQASAGTGKTHTIAAIAARLIAEEGVRAQDLLIITFARAATAELRDRIRERLSHTVDVLDEKAGPIDDADRHLLTLPAEPARTRLRDALLDFDAATISTVHRFCSQAMRDLGIRGESEPGEKSLKAAESLAPTVAADTYVSLAQEPAFTLAPAAARNRTHEVLKDSQSLLDLESLPNPHEDPGFAQLFARDARARADEMRRRSGLVTYADQVLLLRQAVTGSPVAGEAAAILRRRYPVVLVDEFQDTDEAQWAVLEAVFHGHSRLILIGDPKQAIYAFRGGDVHTYVRAGETAEVTETLLTNYRSDPGVVEGVNLLFKDRVLSAFPPIRGDAIHAEQREPRLFTAAGDPVSAFSGRVLDRQANAERLRAAVAADTADQIATALRAGWLVEKGGRRQNLVASDFAVLTRAGFECDIVAAALRERGVPCRIQRTDSALSSPAARDWLTLLRALAEPAYPARGNAAALALLGGSATALGRDPDGFAEHYGTRLRELRRLVDEGGFPALAAAVFADPEALSAIRDVRRLADLRHVSEILGAQQRSTGMVVAALADWLADQIATPAEEHPRRRETDQPAVVIMTVHAAKGLQFPIVYVPYAWTGKQKKSGRFARFHRNGERMLDVRESCEGLDESQRTADLEADDEEMRLLYVALTRAVNRVVWHWAWMNSQERTARSALQRVLGAAAGGQVLPDALYGRDAWQEWAREQPVIDLVELQGPGPPVVLPDPASAPVRCEAAEFTRTLDRDWSRRSFTSITRAAHENTYAGRATVDEPDAAEAADSRTADRPGEDPVVRVSPWADLPSGTGFGTMVHHVLEVTDGDRVGDLPANCRGALARFRVAAVTDDQLAEALRLSMTTPLGPLVGNSDLTAFGKNDRAAELDFEIALDTSVDGGAAALSQLARLLAEELPPDDPLADYPTRLGELAGDLRLRGFLSGQIDAVLRWDSGAGPTYVVVDYKTNWLGPWGDDEPLSTAHYGAESMARAMMDSHYPLQALLYCVALHRHLRWRLGDSYDPEQSLGGVLYLFLRGMVGPDTPTDTGVFSWHPSASLITRASDLLSGVTDPIGSGGGGA